METKTIFVEHLPSNLFHMEAELQRLQDKTAWLGVNVTFSPTAFEQLRFASKRATVIAALNHSNNGADVT